ncbi:hypothetical protein EHM69_02650 [candidate division KSB1 bacterium]|nr:MAG: hypothetical protein EHM69_02650 [candidate division KSB1 bacterium]
MLRRFTILAVLLLFVAAPALAQAPFIAQIYYYSGLGGGSPLTTTCQGSTPLPDGRVIKIFWDSDSDGPDLTDPLAPVCNDPPDCESGEPYASLNMNQFTFNGTAIEFGTGFFMTDPAFRSISGLPTPARYYLRVYELDGITVLWTSTVLTMVSGMQEFYLLGSDWTCGSTPQCIVRDEHE